jgi:tRNA(fMet)-specific endonuclease VapC
MTTYLLDTNIVSHIIRGDIPAVTQRLGAVPLHRIRISVISEAELRYGIEKYRYSSGLAIRVNKFLSKVQVMPWTTQAAKAYAELRVLREAAGKPLALLDMLIAAHAKALYATLVTRDASFGLLPCGIALEDWTLTP